MIVEQTGSKFMNEGIECKAITPGTSEIFNMNFWIILSTKKIEINENVKYFRILKMKTLYTPLYSDDTKLEAFSQDLFVGTRPLNALNDNEP